MRKISGQENDSGFYRAQDPRRTRFGVGTSGMDSRVLVTRFWWWNIV